jgi:hypothetical protein
MSLWVAFEGVENRAMKPNGCEQRSLSSEPDVYEIRPRQDGDGFDLINDQFRYGPIWYAGPDSVRNAAAYAKFRSLSRSRQSVVRVFDRSGSIIETHQSMSRFRNARKHTVNYHATACH